MIDIRAEERAARRATRDALVTLGFVTLAAALFIVAALYEPETRTPVALSEVGEAFFPEFKDPLAVAAIEVIAYNEATATAEPLKVELRGGRFVIPSHNDYPADARARLAKVAGALLDLKRDMLRSVAIADHEQCGVIDPLETGSASLVGRGRRVTLRDAKGSVLADYIIGKEVEGKAGFRYLRVPGQKNTYAVKTDVEASARFEDWIETDLLRLSATELRKITVLSYSVDEQLGGVTNLEETTLTKDGETWTVAGGGAVKQARLSELIHALDNLKIVDVVPKPKELAFDLSTTGSFALSMEAMLSLRRRGFYVTPVGRILANEGELRVETVKDVVYTLRFGEIAIGGDLAAAPPAPGAPAAQPGAQATTAPGVAAQTPTVKPIPPEKARRYLFVTARFKAKQAVTEGSDVTNDGDTEGRRIADELSQRFASWYYVISGTDFVKLRPKKADLVR
jgi:hypothetical protein